MITRCNCEYQIECLEANEVKLAYCVYYCTLNTCVAHIKAYKHKGGFPAPSVYRDALKSFIEVVNKVLYNVVLNYLPIAFNLI